MKIKEAAADFLSRRRIAVTGVSRSSENHGSNVVYGRLRDRGYEVFAVNPATETVAGDRSYPSLSAIPGGVDAVVIGTAPARASDTMQECIDLGIDRVWMHRSFGGGSVSDAATRLGRQHGIVVIDGGCPLMFDPVADGGHKLMCPILKMFGAVPRTVG